jgi:plastocyanin
VRRTAIAASCLLLTAAGCSSTSSTTPPPATTTTPATNTDTIVIQGFAFHPASLNVAPGTTVTVINKDTTTHTVTSSTNPKAFDTGNIAPGATTTFHAPATAGTYAYICEIHQYMQGSLTVR